MISTFVLGQRWVVDSEPELGLGIVTGVQGRTVSIFFEQGDCERNYAVAQAPLTRILFSEGDEISLAKGESAVVKAVHEQNGLLIYDIGTEQLIPETQLSSEVSLNQPLVRLLTGQLDAPKWFYFRRKLDEAVSKTWQSRLGGLLGVRANLISHQLYVAWMACEREKVRVLLADEVGLGKTIEAGMILSRMLKFERVERALILVPDALQVQWLVELVRKFALVPTLYAGEEHDFVSGQIHIVPHSIAEHIAPQLLEAEFDITIVDEAHHILPDSEAFGCLQQLSLSSDHLVLLTATPEQLGAESHFARLQLLDPAKFTSLENLRAAEAEYQQLNERIRALPQGREQLIDDYHLPAGASDEELVDELLDVHGVGRVMFRNVRSAIAGFPKRMATPHLLEDDSWPVKFEWLAQWIKQQGSEKILVICHSIEQVKDCESFLWQKHGIDAALFHEEQNLIERDKAAAYFADLDEGSQILICSEIGSEGRNFQFSCHLVCMDLPEHPDLLEQRIGRLDRIGQNRDVNIHIPYGPQSKTALQLHWYHHVLHCIEQQNPAAGQVHDEIVERHSEALEFYSEEVLTSDLEQECMDKVELLQREIQLGRDALLEMNSCRQPFADELADKITLFEQDTPLELIEMASDLFNFHFEGTYEGIYSLIPSDKMLIPALPGIPGEGTELTFSRDIANRREDLQFMSWDSPFVIGLWEMLHHSDLGSASVATLPSKQLPSGHCLLEVCFDLVIQSKHSAACLPFLNSHSVRSLVLDISDKNLAALLPEASLQKTIEPVKKFLARDVVKSRKNEIGDWYKKAEAFAEVEKASLLEQASARANRFFDAETSRLQNLARHNAGVDIREVEMLHQRQIDIVGALEEQTQLQLSAARLIVITG
ncbi:helicase-related protein [Teredinibacter haidensis]|uniref:helicase-related protein n=1 Tax=Teredinibacter haidensis TaxID=2731755 RepID=UPI000A541154|nr:helicase-related protein [Teredinibacter haidensis]